MTFSKVGGSRGGYLCFLAGIPGRELGGQVHRPREDER